MGSSWFPGKALKKICGIEMLHHCFIRAKLAECFSDIYIATPDQEIHDFSKSIGCKSIDTKDTHTRCTERIAEAILYALKQKPGVAANEIVLRPTAQDF